MKYGEIARFYDRMMGEGKYRGWKKLIAQVVKQYNIPLGACLDVACGTGNISKLLIEMGFRVIGIDNSAAMLRVARSKFPQEKFIRADACEFTLGDKIKKDITFVVSFYDSLNYILTDQDMLKAFQSIYRNIMAGTIFLFDMNTVEHVAAAQKYKPRLAGGRDFYSVYRYSGQDRIWQLDIDMFIKEGKRYRFVREKHTERGYDKKDIALLLAQAGFNLLDVREERKIYEDGIERLSRLYFIAQKPNNLSKKGST